MLKNNVRHEEKSARGKIVRRKGHVITTLLEYFNKIENVFHCIYFYLMRMNEISRLKFLRYIYIRRTMFCMAGRNNVFPYIEL